MIDEKQIETLRRRFRLIAGKNVKQMFELKSNGLVFKFNKLSLNIIGCIKSIKESVKHGFTPEEHFRAAENIKQLFEYSEVIEQHYENKTTRCETHYLCVHQIAKDAFAYMNVVTYGKDEGYIGLYLSKKVVR